MERSDEKNSRAQGGEPNHPADDDNDAAVGVVKAATAAEAETYSKNGEERSLFDEIALNLFAAVNVYGLANLRQFASQGKLKGDPVLIDKLINLPMDRFDAVTLFLENLDDLKQEMSTELYHTAIERSGKAMLDLKNEIREQQQQSEAGSATKNTKRNRRRRSLAESVMMMSTKQTKKKKDDDDDDDEQNCVLVDRNTSTIEVIDDGITYDDDDGKVRSSKNDQLVYSIGVDRLLQEIRLVFRGSVTVRDWAHDANSLLKHERNPLYQINDDDEDTTTTVIPQAKSVGIHDGFHSYMFKKPKRVESKSKKSKTDHTNEEGKSKYDTIHEHLGRLRQEYPNYKVCVTGHSLGAALATLFTFQTAVEDRLEGDYIKCIVFASPRVGNFKFVRAFHELELAGKIRFLRIVNDKDAIPQMPERPCVPTFAVYQHAGVELRLYRNGTYKYRYPKMCCSRHRLYWYQSTLAFRFLFKAPVWCRPEQYLWEDIVRWHGCAEYMDRLDGIQNRDLEETSLSELMKKSHEHVN